VDYIKLFTVLSCIVLAGCNSTAADGPATLLVDNEAGAVEPARLDHNAASPSQASLPSEASADSSDASRAEGSVATTTSSNHIQESALLIHPAPGRESAPAVPPGHPSSTTVHAQGFDTPLANTRDLWRSMRSEMHLELFLEQQRVKQELRWLQRHPEYLLRLQARMQRYLPYIYHQTRLRGLPAELALLPIVESALDTFAFSHGGAAGPWQFISGTARQYGLEINEWYDGRRDIIASTDAALSFLEDLHQRFDDWYLALAGYNAGQGNVSKAQRKKPGAGFFDLALPRETRAYVPRLLALAAVIRNPQAYDLTLPEVMIQPSFYTVNTHSQFQISKIIDLLDITADDLYQWNPAINQWATPPQGPHRIILPWTTIDAPRVAQHKIDALPPHQRVDWAEIRVKPGDTLGGIAMRHNTDVTSLQAANQLNGSIIRAGQKLLIPKNVAALTSTPRTAKGEFTYVVQSGDSLWSISQAHKVSLTKLMTNNHIGPKDTLPVGRRLKIQGISQNQTALMQRDKPVTRKVRYKVRKGDSLHRIADKFNVSVAQIGRWNQLDVGRYLQPGQGLLLYVNVTGG